MKLLIIYHAGLVQDAKAIFREYARQGVDLTVIVPSTFHSSQGQQLTYSPGQDEAGHRFIPVPFRAGRFAFGALFSAIKNAAPEVIHVFDEYSSTYLTQAIICRNILFGKKVPVFAYAFQNIPFAAPPLIAGFSIKSFKRLIYSIGYPLIFWYHNRNVAGVSGSNSQALLNVKNCNPRALTKLIFWGVDFNDFGAQDPAACKNLLHLPPDEKIIGYVGRLVEEKGLDVLIEATSNIKHSRLLLVGGGDCQNELEKLAVKLGVKERVYFFNNVPRHELKTYYNAFDVFVLPSKTMPGWKEQYGRVLVEAMACGLPIVASSSGAISEVLAGYPRGAIFAEGDARNLAQKIASAARTPFSENFNLADFLHKFSVQHFVSEHLNFYKNI